MIQLDKFNNTGKVGLVTGGAGLLGKQHCLALAEIGTTVYLSDYSKELAQKAVAELTGNNPELKIVPIELDVTKKESIESALATILDKEKRFDVLINNAAIDPKVKDGQSEKEFSRFENFPVSDWDFQLDVGLKGAYLCAQVFGSHMASSGGGVILNIASDLSVMAPDQRLYRKEGVAEEMQPVKPVTYSVIKSGLVGLTKYLSTYWADKGVRTNAISPGGVFNNHPEEFVNRLSKLIPMGRMANVDEYRGCVQFLCSDASSYINGINLLAEGGRSVW